MVTDTKVGSSGGTIVATGCEDVGNGIYRVWISGNIFNGAGYMILFASNAAVPTWNVGRPTYTGVAGEDILIWGAQAELGTYPTSYIATTTTAVLRNADVLIAGDMVTDAAGSAYAEASSIWALNNGSPNYVVLQRNNTGYILLAPIPTNANRVNSYDGSTNVYSPIGASYQNRPANLALTWGTQRNIYNDGLTASGAYDGALGAGNLGIGNNNYSGSQWDGTVREVKIFDSELTAAEVGDL